jgi:hypothetical protein
MFITPLRSALQKSCARIDVRGKKVSLQTISRAGTISRAKLEGREAEIFAERDGKLEAARRQRQLPRQEAFLPLSDRAGDASAAGLN